jgi:hypothetical protein
MIIYRINRQERLMTARHSGTGTVEDWRQAIAECPEVVTYDSLNDAREPHTFINAEETRRLVWSVQEKGMADYERRSVVITSHLAHFGISRMFELFERTG